MLDKKDADGTEDGKNIAIFCDKDTNKYEQNQPQYIKRTLFSFIYTTP